MTPVGVFFTAFLPLGVNEQALCQQPQSVQRCYPQKIFAVKLDVEFYSRLGYTKIKKEADDMPNIKPISDLRNYSEVLHDVAVGAPVFLTKNGRGRYAIIDMQD